MLLVFLILIVVTVCVTIVCTYFLLNAEDYRWFVSLLIIAALRSRCGHYIFALWFLLLFFLSSPNLSRRILDVYHTSTHGVALV